MPLPFSKQIYRHGYKVELLVLKKKRDQFHILILGSTLKVRQGFLTSHWCPILCGFRADFVSFTSKVGLGHLRCFDSRRGMTARQEIAPEAKQTFHSRLLMSLNTESEQDPQKLCGFHPIYYLFLLLVCDLFSPHADYQQRQYSRAEEENQHLIGSVWDNLEGNAADKGTYQQRKPSVLSFCNPGDTFR